MPASVTLWPTIMSPFSMDSLTRCAAAVSRVASKDDQDFQGHAEQPPSGVILQGRAEEAKGDQDMHAEVRGQVQRVPAGQVIAPLVLCASNRVRQGLQWLWSCYGQDVAAAETAAAPEPAEDEGAMDHDAPQEEEAVTSVEASAEEVAEDLPVLFGASLAQGSPGM